MLSLYMSLAAGCGGNQSTDVVDAGAVGAGGGRSATGGGAALSTAGRSSAQVGGAANTGGTTGGAVAATGGFSTGGYRSTGGTTSADCNSLVNTAPVVPLTAIAQEPPAPAGGVIANGTYYLTAYQEFTGVGGSTVPDISGTMQYIVVISSSSSAGATFQTKATITVGATTIDGETNGTMVTTGSSYTTVLSCSTTSGNGETSVYTATADQLILFGTQSTHTMAALFTRQ